MFDWLDAGAMGLVAAIVVGLGLYLRNRLDKDQEFLHQLVVSSREQQLTQAAAWEQMVKEMAETNAQTVEAMHAIQEALADHNRQSAMRDEQVANVLKGICERLEA